MKMTRKKAASLVLAMGLMVSGTVFGTMAYLTDTTEQVTNTFTVGKVGITLDEAKVTEYGVEVLGAERVTENVYKLIPGHTYKKDPTVHIQPHSEACYVFIRVDNGLGSYEDENWGEREKRIDFQMSENHWEKMLINEGNNTFELQDIYYYNSGVSEPGVGATGDTAVDLPVFQEFVVKSSATSFAGMEDSPIIIKAAAVQRDGLTLQEAYGLVASYLIRNS